MRGIRYAKQTGIHHQLMTRKPLTTKRTIAGAALSFFCTMVFAQSNDEPRNLKQLADWRRGNLAEQKRFQNYVLATYDNLKARHEICVSKRTEDEGHSAAVMAVEMAIDGDDFDETASASDALAWLFEFWFPCTPVKSPLMIR